MAVITEDLIKLLDGVSHGYKRGRHPDSRHAEKLAAMLRALAEEFEK